MSGAEVAELELDAEVLGAKERDGRLEFVPGRAGDPDLVADHLAGTFTLQYPAKGGVPWIDVGAQTIQIYPHYTFGDRATSDGLARVLAALADCRG